MPGKRPNLLELERSLKKARRRSQRPAIHSQRSPATPAPAVSGAGVSLSSLKSLFGSG